MTKLRSIIACAVLATVGEMIASAQEKKSEVTIVKYEGLKQEVLKHRGKVVIVDFWATFCPPCMKAMPGFIEMQKKHADKGLIVIAVSMDKADDKDAVARANRFLNKVNSPLRNLLLDETDSNWEARFGFSALPCYFIFDRQGKWVRFRSQDFKDGVDYEALEQVVMKMLNEK